MTRNDARHRARTTRAATRAGDRARPQAGDGSAAASASAPAPSAAPICTCATARSRRPSCRLILGHQIVGTHRGRPPRRRAVARLDRRRLPLLHAAAARTCASTRRFTGRDIDGGYAELTVADERFCLELPDELTDEQAAPLLCGGLIGYRALRFTGDAHAARAVRVRLGGSHDLPGRRPPGPRGVRLHPRGRRRAPRSSPAASARRGPAAATSGHPSSSTPRSSSPGRAARPGGAQGAGARRQRWSAPGIHMTRHPELPLRRPVGGARRSARSPT